MNYPEEQPRENYGQPARFAQSLTSMSPNSGSSTNEGVQGNISSLPSGEELSAKYGASSDNIKMKVLDILEIKYVKPPKNMWDPRTWFSGGKSRKRSGVRKGRKTKFNVAKRSNRVLHNKR